MSSPEVELRTGFILDERGRILSTREPDPTRGPLFTLVRSATQCAWAVRDDVASEVAEQIAALAREEPATTDLRAEPVHAKRYLALTRAPAGFSGPAFRFPDALPGAPGVVRVDDERELQRNFRGWKPGELAGGRGPVMAVLEEGCPVSVCFCARLAESTAAAGVETAEGYRGRGYAARVTAAWAAAIRASGRVPLYSAAWTNAPSLAVARKLALSAYASFWSIGD